MRLYGSSAQQQQSLFRYFIDWSPANPHHHRANNENTHLVGSGRGIPRDGLDGRDRSTGETDLISRCYFTRVAVRIAIQDDEAGIGYQLWFASDINEQAEAVRPPFHV